MRLPPNLKYILFSIVAIGIVLLATRYLPVLIPGIGKILAGILVFGMLVLITIFFIKPLVTFLFARADGIFEVYMDKSEKYIHVFSYHLNSGGDFDFGLRDIQHYLIGLESGKLYYNKLFSHTMEPATGRSGWGDFRSFEESVLASLYLTKSLQKLSHKTKSNLQLGKKLKSFGDEKYELPINNSLIEIKRFGNTFDSGYKITAKNSSTNILIWSKRI